MAQVIPGCDEADQKREDGGAEQRRSGDKADLCGRESNRRQIGGQDYNREAVTYSAYTAGGIKQIGIRAPRRRGRVCERVVHRARFYRLRPLFAIRAPLVAGIHAFLAASQRRAWMAGTSPAMALEK
jgi:hypothetical protein